MFFLIITFDHLLADFLHMMWLICKKYVVLVSETRKIKGFSDDTCSTTPNRMC
jgi:hypothetical protein